MDLTFASYNIRKAVGRDRKRDPERILSILSEIGADVVALQEADRRFGHRLSVLPPDAIRAAGYHPAPLAGKPQSLGWHGNALLLRDGIDLVEAHRLDLPTLEPRGAVRADLSLDGRRVRVAGMHLDLSGIRRRAQLRSVLSHLADCEGDCPAVLLGDMNEWLSRRGSLREFGDGWRVLQPGRSYPARRPLGALDRIVVSPQWKVAEVAVHHSDLARWGSDHLPVFARLTLPKT